MRLSLLALILTLGCVEEKASSDDTDPAGSDGDADTDTDADADTDTDTDTDADTDPCTATITGITPADGALDIALDSHVVATFSEAVTAADIDVDGLSGTVTLAGDGTSATFVPDASLSYGTRYRTSASVCDSSASTSFTTVGEALALDLTGRTYDIELAGSDLVWVAPGLGSVLVSQLATDRILFMVESADSGKIDLVGAAGYVFRELPAQYPCTYAIDFDPASFSDHPAFAVGPFDAALEANGIAFDLLDLTIAGTFAEDGESATDVTVTGLLDARPLSEGLGIDVCGLAEGFGDSCVECPDGEVGCLYLEVRDASSPWREDLTIDENQDPTTDRACD